MRTVPDMAELRLERLRPDHAEALLAFERENREYFARTVPDRGDAYFTPRGFAVRHRALLDEQESGDCHFHVLLDVEGSLLGRFNLMDVAGGSGSWGTASANGPRDAGSPRRRWARCAGWRERRTA